MTSKWHQLLQEHYRKLFTKSIEAPKDCVVGIPVGSKYERFYRGFGKTHLILELSNKYRLPIIATTRSQENHLKDEARNLGFNDVRVLMFNRNMRGILRPGRTVLVDGGMEMLTCDKFAIYNNVWIVGFIWSLGGRRPYIHKIM